MADSAKQNPNVQTKGHGVRRCVWYAYKGIVEKCAAELKGAIYGTRR